MTQDNNVAHPGVLTPPAHAPPPLWPVTLCWPGHPYALECSEVLTMEPDMEERRSEVAMNNQLFWLYIVVTSYCTAGLQTGSGETEAR